MSLPSISENAHRKCFCCSYIYNSLQYFYWLCAEKSICKQRMYINNIRFFRPENKHACLYKKQNARVNSFCCSLFLHKNTPVPSGCGSVCKIKENMEKYFSFVKLIHPMLVKHISLPVLYRFQFLLSVFNDFNIFNRINYDSCIVLR